jgi:transcriptional regulator with XRE-family HTH domain
VDATEDPLIAFGAMLRKARLLAGMSQAELAELVQSSQPYISRAERGLENPPILSWVRFASAVNCSFVFAFKPRRP